MRAERNKIKILGACFFVAALFLFSPDFAAAKDVWTSVRTPNFEFVGNASENQMRAAARNLEQFREFFRQQFPELNLKSALPVRVFVFASAESYRQFQPLRADGSIDAAAAGYFQAGLDANYIAFPIGEKSGAAPSTIYHEYVHFILHNNLARANIPTWLNEGLAEYFQTFRIEKDNRARVGEPQAAILRMLETESLMDFESFFKIDNLALQNQGEHGRTLFYAQSWALAHYFQQARREEFKRFFSLLLAGKSTEQAFRAAFQVDRTGLEKELQTYLSEKRFAANEIELKPNRIADAQFQSATISEPTANTFLGSLLLQQNRFAEASALFEKALASDAENADTHAALGVALARQNKFSAAEIHFEKALKTGADGFLPAFYYAYALLKGETDIDGYAKSFPAAKAKKIRALLNQSIAANPNFAESYHLLALVNLINGENLNEAVDLMATAIRLDDSNLRFVYDLGQIKLRLTDYDEAERLAKKVYETTADKNLRLNAQALFVSARNIRDTLASLTEVEEIEVKDKPLPSMSQEEGLLQALNEALRKPQNGERRIFGILTDVECTGKSGIFVVKSEETSNGELIFSAPELQKVRVITFAPDLEGKQISCEAKPASNPIVLTYRPAKETKAKSSGEVVSIEFVPKFFRFLS